VNRRSGRSADCEVAAVVLFDSGEPEETMSNDQLPLPDRLPEPTTQPDYNAIYAEIMATERGRNFLREYASRQRQPETSKLVAIIRQLDAAMRENSPPPLPDALIRGFADLGAAVGQIEGALSANSLNDVHVAVERLQDIAMTLDQREIEAALRGMLEAAIGEVGHAIMRHDATAARALGLAVLMRELARGLNDIIARPATAESGDARSAVYDSRAFDSRASDSRDLPAAERLHDTVPHSASGDGSPLHMEQLHKPLPDPQAELGPQDDAGELFGASMPVPSPVQEEAAHVRSIPRAQRGDPLAALHALSEEEIIALFS